MLIFCSGCLEKYFDRRAGRAAPLGAKHRLVRRLAWTGAAAVLFVGGLLFAQSAYRSWRTGRAASSDSSVKPRVRVGSKDFTESVLLAEIVSQMLEARGVEVERQYELAGNLTHTSLTSGRIDFYPEYTGTAYTAILKHAPVTDPRAVYEQTKQEYRDKFNLEVGPPLGFSNDFAILVRGEDARRLKLKTISDAVPHARGWRAGFGQDFMSRADGYAGFARAYGLSFREKPREMDLSLTYRALANGQVDMIAGNSTDGLINAMDLFQLEDDRHYFPPYEGVIIARRDALESNAILAEVLARMERTISTEEMRALNYRVDGEKRSPREVVAEWLKSSDK